MKSSKIITIVAVIALVTIVVMTLVAGTFARYATTVESTATANTAAWKFEAGLNNKTTTSINLYNTIANVSNTYPNLKSNTIAPGTSGTFDIVIDGTGSEVGIDYTVSIALASGSLPTGLTFSVDGKTIGESFTGIIPLNEENKAITKTVTWSWAIGDDATEETGIDNTFESKEYTINVTIKGEQYIETIE